MSTNPNTPNNSEEVDLGQLFKLIGAAFDRFFNFIYRIFKGLFSVFIWFVFFIKKHIIILVVAGIIGIGIGILSSKTSQAKYQSSVTLVQNYQIGENNPDFESNDELGVTMTTKLSDDILINGKLGVPIGGVTESVIAGDFEIELKLNEDRTLTMKIFNRENTIRNLGEQIGYTQGVGISYKVEFNSFKKLLNKLLVNPN